MLTKARTSVHLFRVAAVHEKRGRGTLRRARGRQAARARLKEVDFRRRGLFVSLAVIVITIVALLLTIRDRERRRRGGGELARSALGPLTPSGSSPLPQEPRRHSKPRRRRRSRRRASALAPREVFERAWRSRA